MRKHRVFVWALVFGIGIVGILSRGWAGGPGPGGGSSEQPDSYQSKHQQTIRVMAHGYCWLIKNLSDERDYFIPTRTAVELEAFIAAAQVNPDFEITECVDCSDPSKATIMGTVGVDTLNGTAGDDVIFGLEGADTIYGNGGNDVIRAGAAVT